MIIESDGDYDDARSVHNGMIDKRPAVIVRVMNAGDVMTTVNYARDNEQKLSIRGGGHSGPGYGTNDGGVVIDFSKLRSVQEPELQEQSAAQLGETSMLRHTRMALPRPEELFQPLEFPG